MAGMSYPPWSAPSTMERDRKSKEKSKKWTNMKRAFKKPWQKRPPPQERSRTTKDRSALPPPAGLEESSFQQMQFGEFSPFGPGHGRQKINPLSGGGNPFLFHQLTGGAAFPNYHPISRAPYPQESSPYKKQHEDEATSGYFDPPTPKPSRPALSNIFPIHDSQTTAAQQKKATVTKTSSAPAQSKPKQLIHERRGSSPAVNAVSPNALKNRHLHIPTSAQSTTSDITDERMGRRERTRRPSAIKLLPVLPPSAERSPPVARHGEEAQQQQDSDHREDDDEAPSHAMYHTPVNLAHSSDNGLSTGMYGWSQQPNEQLQKLEEELDGAGPEGEEEDMRRGSWEREREEKAVAVDDSKKMAKSKVKKKNSGKLEPKGEEVTDFAQEFVRQLTIGGNETDVLY